MPIFPYRLNVGNLLCFHTVIMVAWLLAVHYSSELGHLEADTHPGHQLSYGTCGCPWLGAHCCPPPVPLYVHTHTSQQYTPPDYQARPGVSPILGMSPPSLGVTWLTLSCLFNLYFINTSIKEEMKFLPTEQSPLLPRQ